MNVSNTRRAHRIALAAGVVAGVVLGGGGAVFAAKSVANTLVVQGFIDSWKDPDKSVTYLAPDANLRMEEDKPAVIGPKGYMAVIKPFMSHGASFSGKVLTTFARGPMVVTDRIDTVTTPGKPDMAVKVVGVFIVKHGKIEEWADYVYK